MGYRLNHLDEPVFIAVLKPLPTEFDIHNSFESCEGHCLVFHSGKAWRKNELVARPYAKKVQQREGISVVWG